MSMRRGPSESQERQLWESRKAETVFVAEEERRGGEGMARERRSRGERRERFRKRLEFI